MTTQEQLDAAIQQYLNIDRPIEEDDPDTLARALASTRHLLLCAKAHAWWLINVGYDAGLTQAEVAAALGVSQQYVSKVLHLGRAYVPNPDALTLF